MKHIRLRVLTTALLAVCFVLAFIWIIVRYDYSRLSEEASKEKPLTREAVSFTLENLSEAWTEYEGMLTNRYEAGTVFTALALQSVIDDGVVPEEDTLKNGMVIRIRDGKLTASSQTVGTLGLDASLFRENSGSFAAPNEPSTFVAYSRIGDTDAYYVAWHEDTIISDAVMETIDIPGILHRTEITYGSPAIFVSCDPDSGKTAGILYKNDLFFSDCESLEDLGLTQEDLSTDGGNTSGTLNFEKDTFSYVSGESVLPAGYVILLTPAANLYAKALGRAGYMVAALIILVASLLVSGFSLYPFVHNNILTPKEEKAYLPAHVKTMAAFFGVTGIIIIALCGIFGYSLNVMYDDAVRGKERLGLMNDSISMYMERYSQNMQTFHDVYLDYGNQIASFLDTYPELRDTSVLATLTQSIDASSITLYDSDGCETVSSGPWIGLELGTVPDSSTYDFRRILKGVPAVVHDPETDEVTGLNEMRLGIRIRDVSADGRYGVMMLCVEIPALANNDIDPEKSVRELLHTLSDAETTLWIADGETGRILVSGTEELEGEDIFSLGLGESDLKSSLVRELRTDEGNFLVISDAMKSPGLLAWTGAPDSAIAYCKGPITFHFSDIFSFALAGCILFCVIYMVLAWMILKGYTDDFFNSYKRVKGLEKPGKKRGPIRRLVTSSTPARNGVAVMEVITAFFLIQMVPIVNLNTSFTRTTVYHYIFAGKWERGVNLFAIAEIVVLLAEVALFVICVRIVLAVCASFAGPKGKTMCILLSNVILYIALFFSLIRAFEYLGVSVVAIAASMGTLGLAVSLGAQNFVADVFAGMTYVFEGTIHAGDTVDVSSYASKGFQGTVVEIGIRCIKVLTREGDLVTCSNRDIKLIKNCTQMNSRITCRLVVSSEISAEELRKTLEKELPEIGRTDSRILKGPVYNGIAEIGSGTMTLSVSAECREEDYYYVEDKLNVSLQRIFNEHGYRI